MTDPAVTKAHKAHIYRIIRQWKHWVWNEKAVNSDVELIYNIVAREKDEHAREECSRRVLAEQERFKKIVESVWKENSVLNPYGSGYNRACISILKELEAGRR